MQMTVIWLVSAILACLPLLMAGFFLIFTLPRKLASVKQDLGKLIAPKARANDSGKTESSSKLATESDIDELAKQFFGKLSLSLPAFLLTLFYFTGFALCDAYLSLRFRQGSPVWFFPEGFVMAARPVLYAFIGVYLFNLGSVVRRIYLGDLNEQVFWGAINRLWLSMGLALVALKSGLPANAEASVYFAIGFLANIFLDWVLTNALKVLNLGKPKSEDLPLQMVKGINIWKEYRLEEEGIENVQNLATSDVTELTVRTHYNFRTLIDWIDQAILLTRLTSNQVAIFATQATAISAIELASASPKATGDSTVANALAAKLAVDPALMAATMDRLYEDEYVQDLWNLWQSGKEGGIPPGGSPSGIGPTVRMPLAV